MSIRFVRPPCATAHGPEPPGRATLADMPTGMDLIEAIKREEHDPPAGIATLGLAGTHRWLTELAPGRAAFSWPVDPAYANLEGAVICSWTVALADQALFFAGQTLCGEGTTTRMRSLQLDCVRNIDQGEVEIVATIDEQLSDKLFGRCEFRASDGSLLARVAATIDLVAT